MNVVEIRTTKDTYDRYDPVFVAYGTNPDFMPVFRRQPYGIEETPMHYPSMLKFVFPKSISETMDMEQSEIRSKYGPILSEKLLADISAGKIEPKVYFNPSRGNL